MGPNFETLLGKERLEQFGDLSAIRREGNIGGSSVLSTETPFRLAVPDEINLLHRHCIHLAMDGQSSRPMKFAWLLRKLAT